MYIIIIIVTCTRNTDKAQNIICQKLALRFTIMQKPIITAVTSVASNNTSTCLHVQIKTNYTRQPRNLELPVTTV